MYRALLAAVVPPPAPLPPDSSSAQQSGGGSRSSSAGGEISPPRGSGDGGAKTGETNRFHQEQVDVGGGCGGDGSGQGKRAGTMESGGVACVSEERGGDAVGADSSPSGGRAAAATAAEGGGGDDVLHGNGSRSLLWSASSSRPSDRPFDLVVVDVGSLAGLDFAQKLVSRRVCDKGQEKKCRWIFHAMLKEEKEIWRIAKQAGLEWADGS